MKICKEKFALVFSKEHKIAYDVLNTGLFDDVLCGTAAPGTTDASDDADVKTVVSNIKKVYEKFQKFKDQELEQMYIIFDKHYDHILDKLPKSPVIGGVALCKWEEKNRRPIKVGYL